MNHDLGTFIKSIPQKPGLFGKKPAALEIYANGIILKFKTEDKTYPFADIARIISFDYAAPNSITYNFDLFHQNGEKIAAISIPYEQQEDGTLLLNAHMHAQLTLDFPNNLMDSEFVLDNHLTWKKGKLIHTWRKGIDEYTPQQIDEFKVNKGAYYFTLKDSKNTLGLFLHDAPNCLTTIEVCHAIAAMD